MLRGAMLFEHRAENPDPGIERGISHFHVLQAVQAHPGQLLLYRCQAVL